MISEEHLEYHDELSFHNVYGLREPVNLRIREMLITYRVFDVLFNGYPCMTKENVMLWCQKNYGIQPTIKAHTNLSNLQV